MNQLADAFAQGQSLFNSIVPALRALIVNAQPIQIRRAFWRGVATSFAGVMQHSIGHDEARGVLAELTQAMDVPNARERAELIRTDFQTLQ